MNKWKSGLMGVVTGDALGCPVQFMTREQIRKDPVRGMRGYGTFSLPEGTWTDDSSLTLASLDSIINSNGIDCDDMMKRFVQWLYYGEYTPHGYAFDVGTVCRRAIEKYRKHMKIHRCGESSERSNGNGSLMRIMPVCIWCSQEQKAGNLSDEEAVKLVHRTGSLTHAHIRSNIACGLYYFMVREITTAADRLKELIMYGLEKGFAFYDKYFEGLSGRDEVEYYVSLRDIQEFGDLHEEDISSSGYVVDTLEAAVWSAVTTDSFEEALLKAVNLGEDTDTVGAVTGGLVGLYYGYDAIPEEWLKVLKKRTWIEEMCERVNNRTI